MLEQLRESFQNREDSEGLYETRMHIRTHNRDRVERCIKNILKFWDTEIFVIKR
jgi:hypothetical protein